MLGENWILKSEPVSLNGAPSLFIEPDWLSVDNNLLENAVNIDEFVLKNEPNAYKKVITKPAISNNDNCREDFLQNWFEERIDISDFDGLPISTTENEDQKIQLFVNPAKVIPQPHLQKLQPTWEPSQTIDAEDRAAVDLLQEFEELFNSGKSEYEFQSVQLPGDIPQASIDNNTFYTLIMQESLCSSPQASTYTEDQTPISSPHSSTVSEETPLPAWIQDYKIQLEETSDIRSDSDDNKEECIDEEKEGNSDNCTEDVYIKDESVSSPESIDSPESVDSTITNSDPDWSASTGKASTTRRKTKHGYTRKPYMRVPPEQRKDRKKEQNKNAATRYRQKKKQEFMEIVGEEEELVTKNEDLKEKVTDLEREIKYLKNLLRDLYKVKGLIK